MDRMMSLCDVNPELSLLIYPYHQRESQTQRDYLRAIRLLHSPSLLMH
jgi:hypothetical protein